MSPLVERLVDAYQSAFMDSSTMVADSVLICDKESAECLSQAIGLPTLLNMGLRGVWSLGDAFLQDRRQVRDLWLELNANRVIYLIARPARILSCWQVQQAVSSFLAPENTPRDCFVWLASGTIEACIACQSTNGCHLTDDIRIFPPLTITYGPNVLTTEGMFQLSSVVDSYSSDIIPAESDDTVGEKAALLDYLLSLSQFWSFAEFYAQDSDVEGREWQMRLAERSAAFSKERDRKKDREQHPHVRFVLLADSIQVEEEESLPHSAQPTALDWLQHVTEQKQKQKQKDNTNAPTSASVRKGKVDRPIAHCMGASGRSGNRLAQALITGPLRQAETVIKLGDDVDLWTQWQQAREEFIALQQHSARPRLLPGLADFVRAWEMQCEEAKQLPESQQVEWHPPIGWIDCEQERRRQRQGTSNREGVSGSGSGGEVWSALRSLTGRGRTRHSPQPVLRPVVIVTLRPVSWGSVAALLEASPQATLVALQVRPWKVTPLPA
jgi:hypothetical protein